MRDFNLGRAVAGWLNPDLRRHLSDVEQRVLAEGVDASGGFATPEVLSGPIIDAVRNASVVVRAGARTLPITSDEQSWPKIETDPVPEWRAENAAYAEDDLTFARVKFEPKNLGVIVRLSDELSEDMIGGGTNAISNAITSSLALELDRAALRGDGTSNAPTGVRFQSGVTLQAMGANGGALTRYQEVMSAVTTLLTANREPNAYIMAPRTSQTMAGFIDTTNQPLQPPQPVADLARFVSNQIPTNITKGTATDASELYVGQWSDLLIGVRVGVSLKVLDQRYADVGQVAIRARLRADVQLAHAASFVVIPDIVE